MKKKRIERFMKLMVPGVLMLQAAGCDLTTVNETLQTAFLGITAAGSIAILQNL